MLAISAAGLFLGVGIVLLPHGKSFATVPGTNTLINFNQSNTAGSDYSTMGEFPSVSSDGKLIAFSSASDDIVTGDTNGNDIFVRNTTNGTSQRVSVDSSGDQSDGVSYAPHISGNGRYVVFESNAGNLDSPFTYGAGGAQNVFIHDLQTGTTRLVTSYSSGYQSTHQNYDMGVSNDGRFVLFMSDDPAFNSSSSTSYQIYLKDMNSGTMTLISQSSSGSVGNSDSPRASMSCDGSFIAFESAASNLVSGDTNGYEDIFVVDLINGTTIKDITINGDGDSFQPYVACDGDYVALTSNATNLVTGDTNGNADGFIYDREANTINRVTLDNSGNQTADGNANQVSISSDGHYAVFFSDSTDYTSADLHGHYQIFLRDLKAGTTELLSQISSTSGGNGDSMYSNISADGTIVAYASKATNLTTDTLVNSGNFNYFTSATGGTVCSQ